MKNKFNNLVVIICLMSSNVVLAYNDLCIALTNNDNFPVEFSGLIDPGYTYTIKPGNSATLSGDHMQGACIAGKNDCSVSISILDGTYQHYEIIRHLTPGSRIIYRNLHDYDIDKNANIKCG